MGCYFLLLDALIREHKESSQLSAVLMVLPGVPASPHCDQLNLLSPWKCFFGLINPKGILQNRTTVLVVPKKHTVISAVV